MRQHSDSKLFLNHIEITAYLQQKNQTDFSLTFKLNDPLNQVLIQNKNADFNLSSEIPRQDELWKTTCFECFLQPEDSTAYYEFNFSISSKAWNCYYFENYRSPQPPRPSQDFELTGMNWGNSNLTLELKNNSSFKNFNVGLTAVIQNLENNIFYFAAHHAGEKPDFHLSKSFILKRGLSCLSN